MIRCLIEANVTTSQIIYPLQRGWLDTPDWLTLQERVTWEELTSGEPACGLIDAIDATKLSDSHVVLTDLALVSLHLGSVAMRSTTRPDEVQHATVQLGTSSSTAEAIARATVFHFYGIDVVDWTRTGQSAEVEIVEGAEALVEPAEESYLEDLVRAWFILSSLAIPTHLFVVPRDAVQQEPDSIRRVLATLNRSADLAEERRRELRRNLAEDHGIDREALVEFHSDQKLRLTKSARKGWLDLARRAAHQMSLPRDLRPEIQTFDARS